MWIELTQTEQSKTFRVLLKASDISSIEEAKNDSSSFKTKINFLDRTAIFVTNHYDEVKKLMGVKTHEEEFEESMHAFDAVRRSTELREEARKQFIEDTKLKGFF